MILLPAIDLLGGHCVRLRQGDYAQRTDYSADPVEVAKSFEDQGATWLHVVDLDGAKSGSPVHLQVIGQIREKTALRIEFGGGLRSDESIDLALSAGSERVVLGTRLVGDAHLAAALFAKYGDQIVAGLDLKDGRVAIEGWTERSENSGIEFARELATTGARRFIVTDVATDGMLRGPNLPLLRQMVEAAQRPVIASGGVSSLDDLRAIAKTGAEGVIVGRALYDSRFTVAEALVALQ